MVLLAALLVGLAIFLAVSGLLGSTPHVHLHPGERLARRLAARQRWLSQAGSPLTADQFYLGSAGTGLAVTAVVVLGTGSVVTAVLTGAAAAVLPHVYFTRQRKTRLDEVQQAWPDGLRELLSWVKVGYSIPEALSRVAEHGPPPLRRALAQFPARVQVYSELVAIEMTREELADPTADRILEVLALGTEHGGGDTVVEILQELIEHATEDLRIIDEIKSNTLSGKINAQVVFAVPWVAVAVLSLTFPHFRAFYGTRLGLVVLGVGALLSGGGLWWVLRLGRIPPEQRVFDVAVAPLGPWQLPAVPAVVPLWGEVRQPGQLAAAALVGLTVFLVARRLVPRTPRLARRVRPYAAAERIRLGGSADLLGVPGALAMTEGTLGRLYGPPLLRVAALLARLTPKESNERLLLRLHQLGKLRDVAEEDRVARYRMDLLRSAVLFAAAGLIVGALYGSAALALAGAGCGLTLRLLGSRASMDRAVRIRRELMRIELYTVNQLLATYLRISDGPAQAMRRLVRRGHGLVVNDLGEALRLHQAGKPLPEALRQVAARTPEPFVARTLQQLAVGSEHGADLAAALLDLSKDIRSQRREDIRRAATRREAQTLIPTVLVMTPVFVLFIVAPLPSFIFGQVGG
jgi:Flp pilus assembly protein TadB